MSYSLHGMHLIAGTWTDGKERFFSDPASGPFFSFSAGTAEDVNAAAQAAEDSFWSFGHAPRHTRAEFLNAIADEIEARGDSITEIGSAETGLPETRLIAERGRTIGQLRLFAAHIAEGAYLDHRQDPALPDRQPLARPELRMIQRPIGPVAVFGASNFPLAFSVAGGDTASALAAGCPVIVKGHGAHPGTGEIVADAIQTARVACGLAPGVFSFIQGDSHKLGAALVQHPLIKAVGFTGSLAGGRALFDLCAARPEPVPFFGELGSVNPMFVLPQALAERTADIATGWAASLTMGAGQFCTNPGIAILLAGPDADLFVKTARKALGDQQPQTMLTNEIAAAYETGKNAIHEIRGVSEVLSSTCGARAATPALFKTDARTWLNTPTLGEEVFGPLGLVVLADNYEEMREIALGLAGQLTVTLHLDQSDLEMAVQLMPILERKAGRVLANGFPTGVEVCDSMVHGGPYPASTNFGATSVGTMAIRRFLRPVCYQNMPPELVPEIR